MLHHRQLYLLYMDNLSLHPLNDRESLILQHLVATYLETAEPVGSQAIAEALGNCGIQLSSATVRNTLSALDGAGFLEQPHTSAGRIPTREGLIYYVRHLMQVKPLSSGESLALQQHLSSRTHNLQAALRETSRLLTELSQYASLVVMPRTVSVRIKHIEFVQLGSHRLLGILVAQNGTVYNRPLESDALLTLADLEKMSNYCNSVFFGLTIDEAIEKSHREFQEATRSYDAVVARTIALSTQVLEAGEASDVIVDGPWGLIDHHADVSMLQVRRRLNVLQEKSKLLSLMRQFQELGRAEVTVGSADPTDLLSECSMVTAPYAEGRTILGCVGVMGPMRMDYSRVVPIVQSAAQYIGEWLEGQ